jgi:hypothetical protein
MIRISKFGSGFNARSLRQPEARVEIFDPTRGVHVGEPPQDLAPGFTPEARNFVHEGGWMTPRSGLSRYGAFTFGDAVTGGFEAFDLEGKSHLFAMTPSQVGYINEDGASWSTLSYVRGNTLASDDAPSAASNQYWSGTHLYDSAGDRMIAVFTQPMNFPKFTELAPSIATFSDFTFAFSLLSKAEVVASFNDRFVWSNTQNGEGERFPQRVVWSARNLPTNYTIADGAGFEDLLNMRGRITALVPDGDTLIVFGEEEIWRARPRFDAYVFDFYPVTQALGCPYPQTIARIPGGVIFLARDFEVYLLAGNQLQPLGPTEPGAASRIQPLLRRTLARGERAWAVYNSAQRRYELHYPESSTSGYPERALYFSLDNGSWWPQRFSHELSFGFEGRDTGAGLTWDALDQTWDSLDASWDLAGSGMTQRTKIAFGSAGTAYRQLSTQTTDDGTAIDCRWRSHALNSRDQLRFDQLYEVNIEADVPSASSMSVMVSDDLGASFVDGFAMALSASSITNAFAPVWVTARAPQFEIRLNDGGKPKIARIQARLRDAGLHGGGR